MRVGVGDPVPVEGQARVAFLLAGVAWRDDLLQSARRVNAILAAGLLVAGTLLAPHGPAGLGAASILAIIDGLLARRLVGVSRARGREVAWWQRELLMAERELPTEQRDFTRFKMAQDTGTTLAGSAFSGQGLSDTQIATIVGPGGMTARIYDEALPRLVALAWAAVLVAGVLMAVAG